MTNGSVNGMRVAILLGDNFEQVEMTEPRTALEAAGAHTTLVSPVHGEIHGVQHDQELRDSFEVDLPLEQANSEDFDALLLPGGALNADSIRMVPEVQAFIRRMQEAGKPMAVICHAPWELVSAGVIEGRTLTSYYTLQDDIRNAGGTWLDREVVRDGNLVTIAEALWANGRSGTVLRTMPVRADRRSVRPTRAGRSATRLAAADVQRRKAPGPLRQRCVRPPAAWN
jgi:protease I